ncbi:MAG: hypothetical protein V2A76_00855 [Planctomycetota bacterium]
MSEIESKPKPRRLRRLLLVLIGLVVVAVVAYPFIISSLGPGLVQRLIQKELRGTASLDKLSMSYGGDVRLSGLTVVDEQERPLLSMDRLDVDAELMKALSGEFRATVEVDGFELHVQKGETEKVSLAEIRRKKPATEPPGKTDEAGAPPDLHLDFLLKNGRVIVHGEGGQTELRDLTFQIKVDGLDREAEFRFSADLVGPQGPAGRVGSSGSVVPLPADSNAARANLVLTVEGLLLQGLSPAISLVSEVRGLSGRMDADAALVLTEGLGGSLRANLNVLGLAANDREGRPLDLGELANSRVKVDAALDPKSGSLTVPELTAHLGSVRVDGRIGLSGLGAGFKPEDLKVEESSLQIDADLDRLASELSGLLGSDRLDLSGSLRALVTARQEGLAVRVGADIAPSGLRFMGYGLEGAPLNGSFLMERGEERTGVRGGFATDRIDLTLGPARSLHQEQVRLDFDLSRRDSGEMEITQARYASKTAGLDATGRIGSDQAADLQLVLKGGMERILADLRGLTGEQPYQASGDLTANFRVEKSGTEVSLVGDTNVEQLHLVVTPKKEGQAPLVVDEERVKLTMDGRLSTETGNIDLRRVAVDSRLIRGDLVGKLLGIVPRKGEEHDVLLEGIKGEFFYVPDRLGVVLSPWLPGELSGQEEERLALDLNGRFDDLDLMTLLESSSGDVQMGLGTFRIPGMETTGTLALGLDKGRAKLTGDMGANGGTLDLIGDLGQQDASQRASLKLDMKEFKVNTDLGDLLSLLHPSFGSLGGGKNSRLDGLVECNIELTYGKQLSLRELASSWTSLDPRLLQGSVFFDLKDAILTGSPLLTEMLDKFGLTSNSELVLEPIQLNVDGGRLNYAEPWKWKLGGIKTFFTGSVGFDRTLDLKWNIPINKQLVKRYDFLKVLEGESVEIPLTGTSSAPHLAWEGIIEQLAVKAARKAIAEETGLGDLGGLAGILGGKNAPADDPKKLLDEANTLWEGGKRNKAAKIYRRLESEFKLTPVYLFNKDLIKERADFKKD